MRKNIKSELPLLTNSLIGRDININRVNKSSNKELRNIQIGMMNFNSKKYEIRKNKVKENKMMKFNPSNFGNF